MKVCVYGDSLHGWIASAAFAETGNRVWVDAPEDSDYPAREPGLRELVEEQRKTGRLVSVTSEELYAADANIHVIAAGHDMDVIRGTMVGIMVKATRAVTLLVMASLPVGSLDDLQAFADARVAGAGAHFPVTVIGMPVFIRAGSALSDFNRPAMLLISGEQASRAVQSVLELMRPFARQAEHVMIVSHPTAELIKMGITSMLAMRISFINEMAALSEKLGVDIDLVREGLAADPRIGGAYLQPGCGFGGPSFASDLLSYSRTFKEELEVSGLIDAVITINQSQREILFRKLWRFFRGRLDGLRIAIWGASFKPDTASIENSVIHPLLQALWAQGCNTVVYDPMASGALRLHYPDEQRLSIAETAVSAATGADALVIVTEWDEFWNPDFEELRTLLKQPAIFDGRNIYDPDFLSEQGFRYFGIGRGERI